MKISDDIVIDDGKNIEKSFHDKSIIKMIVAVQDGTRHERTVSNKGERIFHTENRIAQDSVRYVDD